MKLDNYKYRIAIDARGLLLKQRGMPTYVSHICSMLPTKIPNAEFYFLINPSDDYAIKGAKEEINRRYETMQNVNIVELDARDDIDFETSKVPKFTQDTAIDILHMPSNNYSLNANCKQIITIHDLDEYKKLIREIISLNPFKHKHIFYTIKIKIYKWFCYNLGIKKADALVTISNTSKLNIINSFPASIKKITSIYHGVPEQFLSEQKKSTFIERSGVLMLGGMSSKKNPITMIKAYSNISKDLQEKHRLIICGINQVEVPEVKMMLIHHKITNFELHSWVDDDMLIHFFSNAICFLFMSKKEGFGLPLIQAMSKGTPVITSRHPALAEIGDTASLNFDWNDHVNAGKAIESLMQYQEKWDYLSEKSFQRSQDFRWESVINNLASVYQNTIQR